jgi:hypothetical protein
MRVSLPMSSLTDLIDQYLTRYPAMTPADVYKLLYQGTLGPAHLIASPEDFAARLRAEYETVSPRGAGLLWEPVRPDGVLGRLNLRPFKARGGDVEALVVACLQTAERDWGTPEQLRTAWAGFVALCRTGRWEAFDLEEVLTLTIRLEEQSYPAVHHSARYREAYRPAYRLVSNTATSKPGR